MIAASLFVRASNKLHTILTL